MHHNWGARDTKIDLDFLTPDLYIFSAFSCAPGLCYSPFGDISYSKIYQHKESPRVTNHRACSSALRQGFLCFYCIELTCRASLWKRKFLCGPRRLVMWSLLDLMIVSAGVVETWTRISCLGSLFCWCLDVNIWHIESYWHWLSLTSLYFSFHSLVSFFLFPSLSSIYYKGGGSLPCPTLDGEKKCNKNNLQWHRCAQPSGLILRINGPSYTLRPWFWNRVVFRLRPCTLLGGRNAMSWYIDV